MADNTILSILSRSISCETGYVRRYIYVIKSIALFLIGKHFFVTPIVFFKRIILSGKVKKGLVMEKVSVLRESGYTNVKDLVDRASLLELQSNCEKLHDAHVNNSGQKAIICKNSYWHRLNDSWEGHHIKEVLKVT